MATTTPHQPEPRLHVTEHRLSWQDLQPEAVFDALIWENPEVCSDCFARIRDREEHGEDATAAARLGTGNRPDATLQRAGAGTVGQDSTDHDAYGAIRTWHGRTYCGECGQPSGRARQGTMSLDAALDRVPTLLERFREQWLAIDPDTVYTVVRRGKTHDEYRDHTRAIFAAAVKLGVRAARD